MLKVYLKSYIYLFGIIITLTIILSITNYFLNIPSYLIKLLIPIISLLVSTIILGKNVKEKAYLEGIKFTSIYLIFTIIIKLIFKTNFNYKVIIFYLVLLFTGIMGSMIGINSKKNKV